MKNKKQHFVPKSYLKAWCDPDTPARHEPYVWVFNRDSRVGESRAPINIFWEADFYTQPGQDGERDLILEEALNRIETQFIEVRSKLEMRLPLSVKDHFWLSAFCAAMHGRTRAQREHRRKYWEETLETMKGLSEWAKTAPPDKLQSLSFSGPSSSKGRTLSQEDVERIVEYPAQTALPHFILIETPILCQMSLGILYTDDDLGFITSDHPCVWFDPEHRFPGLASETIEVTLPVSPKSLLFFNRLNVSGYIPVPPIFVREANRRMLYFGCEREYIVRRNQVRPYWFVADPFSPMTVDDLPVSRSVQRTSNAAADLHPVWAL